MQISWTAARESIPFLLILSANVLQKDPTTFSITMKDDICVKLGYSENTVYIDGFVFGEDPLIKIIDLIQTVHDIVKVPMSGILILRGEVRNFTVV